MIDSSRLAMREYLLQQAKTPGVGNPPHVSPPPSLGHNSGRPPHSEFPYHMLSPEQRQERENWMIDEASRVISSQQRSSSKPFTPQFPTPDAYDAEGAGRQRITQIASQLAASLADRDKAQGR